MKTTQAAHEVTTAVVLLSDTRDSIPNQLQFLFKAGEAHFIVCVFHFFLSSKRKAASMGGLSAVRSEPCLRIETAEPEAYLEQRPSGELSLLSQT